MTLQDPSHGIRFVTATQPTPGDWLDVEYERSDWVEERLVEVLRTGVEIIAQDVSRSLAVSASNADFGIVCRDEDGPETIHRCNETAIASQG
jgi:hypothetical protein